MSKIIGNRLPEVLLQKLSGKDIQSVAEKAVPVCTVDSAGWVHPAMLSYFEIVAPDAENLRLAIYKDSSTASSLRRNGKLTILFVDERMAYYVKGTATEVVHQMSSAPYNSKFNFRVEQVLADAANEEFEPGVYITSGITYRRPAMPRNANAMLQELLA